LLHTEYHAMFHEHDEKEVRPKHPVVAAAASPIRGGIQLGSSENDDDDDAPMPPHNLVESRIDYDIEKAEKPADLHHFDEDAEMNETISDQNHHEVPSSNAGNPPNTGVHQRPPPSTNEPTVILPTSPPSLLNNSSAVEEEEESLPVLEATLVDDDEPIQITYQQLPPGPVYNAVPIESSSNDDDPWWKKRKGRFLIFGLVLLFIAATVIIVVVVSSTSGENESNPTDTIDTTLQPIMPSTTRLQETSPPSFQPIKPGVSDGQIISPAPSGQDVFSSLQNQTPSSYPSAARPLFWEQLGDDIDGDAAYDQSGGSVSLSANGMTLAIGSPFNDDNGDDSGCVNIFNWDNSTSNWINTGQSIHGEAGDWTGWSVDLSNNGKVIAIGAIFNRLDNDGSGIVRVYELEEDTMSWNQLGRGIDGEDANDASGASVAVSGDGRTLAIGAPGNSANGLSSGHVRVYRFDGADWGQLGRNINGDKAGDGLGSSLAISTDGLSLAVGSPFNDNNGDDSGNVKVYLWLDDAFDWKQVGQIIQGELIGDQSGSSVDLSDDGTTLAIGATYHDGSNGNNSGNTRIYKWGDDTSSWEQLGQSIDGAAAGDQAGSVTLSADGKTVAIGAIFNDGQYGKDSGSVRIYGLDSATLNWRKVGQDIDGEAAGDWSGRSVALSAEGNVVAIGATYNNGNHGTHSGHTRVFHISV